ncbi:putative symporter [Nocardia nova SH22a]|uniref:Putative symporter n=1 Tax=Nocardia nova SH22a TaxID=1415166 RepID=W5TK92_9NOCA|nr:cation acetate symporter [Nocardia nova]AHH19657.1 putative symporter [Nocardia nova SH22a]
MNAAASAAAVAVVASLSVAVGVFGLRTARTTRDFYLASRTVTPRWNAAAVGGEYLSAASFLGVAGLVLAYGYDALWYPVGYTAGYLLLLAVVSAPLRRSGAYTLPDFAEIRMGSRAVRRVAAVLVVVIGWVYLVPQLQGAGLTLAAQTGAPRWLGMVLVGTVVLVAATVAGMRSITFTQALQYWLKFIALLIPAVVLLGVWQHRHDGIGTGYPVAAADITVAIHADETVHLPADRTITVRGSVDGVAANGPVLLTAGDHRLSAGSSVVLRAGDIVPVVDSLPARSNAEWLSPLGSGQRHPLYSVLSLTLGICLGTMGLPHILVRFYTNPDGRDARRTTIIVIVLLSLFYLLPTLLGVFGRHYAADLLVTGDTDATVLLLPERMIGGTAGAALGALVTAGAFAAFLSTASGLTVSVAGVLSQEILREPRFRLRPHRIRAFRAAAVVSVLVPIALASSEVHLGLAAVVGLAFTIAASTFCPLLVLGVWWPRLTVPGALAGLLTGGVLSTTAAVVTLVSGGAGGWSGALLAQPAAWVVPVTFAVMITVSKLTPLRVPGDTHRIMARLHIPDPEPAVNRSSR